MEASNTQRSSPKAAAAAPADGAAPAVAGGAGGAPAGAGLAPPAGLARASSSTGSATGSAATPPAAPRVAAAGAGGGGADILAVPLAALGQAPVNPFLADPKRAVAMLGSAVHPGAGPLAAAGPRMHEALGRPGALAAPAEALSRASSGMTQPVWHTAQLDKHAVLERPRLLPQLPAFLLNWVVKMRCSQAALRSHLEVALRAAGVDFDYRAPAWKAKAYVYTPSSSCHFVAKLYAEEAPPAAPSAAAAESWVLELIRRSGNHATFRTAYDRVLASLAAQGVVDPGCAAAERARSLAAAAAAGAAAAAAAGGAAAAGLPCPPRSLLDDTVDPEDDAAAAAATPAPAPAPAPGAGAGPLDAAPVAEAFTALSAMLSQEYDDVATPAAQSICALTVSRRVRAALGLRARPVLDRFFNAHASGDRAGAAEAAADPVLRMFDVLVRRTSRREVSSTECWTAAAMATANLARDANCAVVLARLAAGRGAAEALCGLVQRAPAEASTGALRRSLAQLVRNLLLEHAAAGCEASTAAAALVPGMAAELRPIMGPASAALQEAASQDAALLGVLQAVQTRLA